MQKLAIVFPKMSCYHHRRAFEKSMKEIHSDDFKIKLNKLTLKIKTLNKQVDIYTCG